MNGINPFECTPGSREFENYFATEAKHRQRKNEQAQTLEILTELYEYAVELRGEWAWKKGERAGNDEEFQELENTLDRALLLIGTIKHNER